MLFLGLTPWADSLVAHLKDLSSPVCVVLFAILFCETALFSARTLEAWRHGWLAAVPDFARRASWALVARLVARSLLRLALAWVFILELVARTPAPDDVWAFGSGITFVIVAGNLGRLVAPRSREKPLRVLRVSPLTARMPGRLWVWQGTLALTAWRTPTAAWWSASVLLSIPNGLPLVVTALMCLAAFAAGATAAAWQLSIATVPQASLLMHSVSRRGLIAQGLPVPMAVLVCGVTVGFGVAIAVGMPAVAAAVAAIIAVLFACIEGATVLLRTANAAKN